MAKTHSSLNDIDGIHKPKDFTTAPNASAPTRDENGNYIWRSLSQFGEQGPQGDPGTTLKNIEVANINDATAELASESGSTDGDVIFIHENVTDGANPMYEYIWNTSPGIVKSSPPFVIHGDGGFWNNKDLYFFQGKCSLDQVSPFDYHGRISHVHRQGRWYGLHMGGLHQILSRNGFERSVLSGTDVNFHEQKEDKIKTLTLSSNTTLTFSGYQLLDQMDLEIQSTASETLAFPSYATITGEYDTTGVVNFVHCQVNNEGTAAIGTITVTNNALDAGDSLEVAGTTIINGADFVAGLDTSETAFNICRAFSEESALIGIASFSVSANVITVSAYAGGVAGNSLTMSKTDNATNNFTLSGGTLENGVDGEVVVNIMQAGNISLSKAKSNALLSSLSTGWIDGLKVTVNADPTKYDIAPGEYRVVDSFTDPANPVCKNITFDGATAVSPTNLTSEFISIVALDADGVIDDTFTGPLDADDRRDFCRISI